MRFRRVWSFCVNSMPTPIDLGSGTQVDTNIPNFGDYLTEEKLGKQWLAYLSATDHALLKHLYNGCRK